MIGAARQTHISKYKAQRVVPTLIYNRNDMIEEVYNTSTGSSGAESFAVRLHSSAEWGVAIITCVCTANLPENNVRNPMRNQTGWTELGWRWRTTDEHKKTATGVYKIDNNYTQYMYTQNFDTDVAINGLRFSYVSAAFTGASDGIVVANMYSSHTRSGVVQWNLPADPIIWTGASMSYGQYHSVHPTSGGSNHSTPNSFQWTDGTITSPNYQDFSRTQSSYASPPSNTTQSIKLTTSWPYSEDGGMTGAAVYVY